MAGRTRSELQAENLVLLRELEEIRNRLDDLLAEEDFQEGEDDDGPAPPDPESAEDED